MSYKTKNKSGFLTKNGLLIAFIISCFWLFLSTIADRSPIRTIKGTKDFFLSSHDNISSYSRKQLEQMVIDLENQITELNNKNIEINANQQGKSALIQIKDTPLNFRVLPSTNSLIIGKLIPNTEVQIIDSLPSLDTLQGDINRWFQVKHQLKSGWIWGKYLSR